MRVQMEVTSDLSCGVSRRSCCQTMDCFDKEPRLFVPHLFICDVVSLNVGICSLRDLGLVPLLMFFFFSKCQPCAAQSSHPRSFEYLQLPLKSYVSQSLSQWVMCVSCSWLYVVSCLQRLLSNTVPERQGGRGTGHSTRPQQRYRHSPMMLLLLTLLQTTAITHTHFKRALPLIPPVLLQLTIDSSDHSS